MSPKPSSLGHSIGWWDGDLVVETTKGNYSLPGILAGARAAEKAPATAKPGD